MVATDFIVYVLLLSVNDILNRSGGYLSAEKICKEIKGRQIIPQYLQRILRYLACFDVVDEQYENQDENNNNQTIAFKSTDVLKQLPINPMFFAEKFFPRLLEIVDGSCNEVNTPAERILDGKNYWQFVKESPEHNQLFINTLVSVTDELLEDVPKIAEVIKNEDKSNASIIDIGGSTGQMMELLYKEMPTLKCINFDLAEVIGNNKPIPNVKMLAGDMFNAETLPSTDIFFTKNVFHDWSDEQCVSIMKNIQAKINDDGIMLSINYMLPEPAERKEAWWNRSMDMTLLALFGKARTRTETEYRQIHLQAGFSITKTVVIGKQQRPSLVIVARKTVT